MHSSSVAGWGRTGGAPAFCLGKKIAENEWLAATLVISPFDAPPAVVGGPIGRQRQRLPPQMKCSFGVSSLFNASTMGWPAGEEEGRVEGGHDGIVGLEPCLDLQDARFCDNGPLLQSLPLPLCLAFPSALSFCSLPRPGLRAYDVALRPMSVDT